MAHGRERLRAVRRLAATLLAVALFTTSLGFSSVPAHGMAGVAATIVRELDEAATNAAGQPPSHSYDPVGRRISTTNAAGETTTSGYNDAGELTADTNANGNSTSYTYTGGGMLATVTDPLARTTSYGYDQANRRTTATDPAGNTTSTVFDDAGQPIETLSAAGVTSTRTYSPLGLVDSSADELGNTTGYTYDQAGRTTVETDPRGNTTGYSYNQAGRLSVMTDALGGTVSFGYDPAGQRTSVTDSNNNTRTATYTDAGLLKSAADPLGRTSTRTYDPTGRQTSATDARGETITTGYDTAGRRISETSAAGSHTFGYDLAGRRTQMVDPTGTTSFAYDPAGNLTTLSAPAGTVMYAYDPAGQPVTRTQPAGTVTTGFGAAGEIVSVTDWDNQTTSYTHDPDLNVTGIDRPNGVDTTRLFDAAGRLKEVAHTGPSGQIDAFDYTLDGNGNRIAVNSTEGVESYTIDKLNRLTNVSYPDNTTETFGYDPAGNRTATDAGGITTLYTYDQAAQLTADSTGLTYNYDQNGNLTGTSSGDSYTYDPYNNQTTATNDGIAHTAGFDADHTRTSYDNTNQLWDRNTADGVDRLIGAGADSFVHGPANTLTQTGPTGTTHSLADGLGSVRYLTDLTGTITGDAGYTAFGNTRTGTPGQFGYTGEQTDPTGQLHLRARTYNPATGRFAQTDPVQPGAPGTPGWNPYTYTANNPTTWTDPTGQAVFAEYTSQIRDSAKKTRAYVAAQRARYQAWKQALGPYGRCGVGAAESAASGAIENRATGSNPTTFATILDGLTGCFGGLRTTKNPTSSSATQQSAHASTSGLTDLGNGTFRSKRGLFYGADPNPAFASRVDHVLAHGVDNVSRPVHGVFTGRALDLTDEAWGLAQTGGAFTVQQGQRTLYFVDMGRPVGYVGGQAGAATGNPTVNYVQLVMQNGDELVTSFPVSGIPMGT